MLFIKFDVTMATKYFCSRLKLRIFLFFLMNNYNFLAVALTFLDHSGILLLILITFGSILACFGDFEKMKKI